MIKSVKLPEGAIVVYNQLPLLLSKHDFDVKKWIYIYDEAKASIPEKLKSSFKSKQVDVEPNTEGSSLLGLQWIVTDDSFHVCKGINKDVGVPFSHGKVRSRVSSMFYPIIRSIQRSHETFSAERPEKMYNIGATKWNPEK